jgi:hypothetical protein
MKVVSKRNFKLCLKNQMFNNTIPVPYLFEELQIYKVACVKDMENEVFQKTKKYVTERYLTL